LAWLNPAIQNNNAFTRVARLPIGIVPGRGTWAQIDAAWSTLVEYARNLGYKFDVFTKICDYACDKIIDVDQGFLISPPV
jgi:hypothetical protein